MRDTLDLSSVAGLTLARPSAMLFASYAAFIDEMRAAGETVWPTRVPSAGEDDATFVARLLALASSAEPPMVPQTIYWGCLDDVVVGLIVLRHELTEKLAQYGGNVSYEVRPSYRRRGVATEMLRLVLSTERAQAMGRLLVTCDPNNAGSRKTIEANGGVLKGVIFADEVERETCHYWIDVRLAAPPFEHPR